MEDLDLSNVDERCRDCQFVAFPYCYIKEGRHRRVTCRLSAPEWVSDDYYRGFYGLANPDKCNNATTIYDLNLDSFDLKLKKIK